MDDEKYMQRCLDLAVKGLGNVAPNPLVGSLIVHNGEIISEGYHQKYGDAHAEVNAIKSVKNVSLLPHSTLYVNLEPCSHHGKTPPCSNLIIESKIPRVVIGCIDTYSQVSGKGIQKLKDAGLEVEVGVLEKESKQLNKRFFTFHEKNRPYIILKWAESKDGFMEPERTDGQKGSISVSGEKAGILNHQWRHEEAGILIGKNTLTNDDPSLTVRNIKGNHPMRILLSNEQLISDFQLLNDEFPTIHIGKSATTKIPNKKAIQIDAHNLKEVLHQIKKENISSIIVEGGQKILSAFIEQDLWDEIRTFTSKEKIFGSGLKSPQIPKKFKSISVDIGDDILQKFTK